jgi:predicted RNase H-like nuclease (RuvC/YqgF family)
MGVRVDTFSNKIIDNMNSRIRELEEQNKNLTSYVEYMSVVINTLAKHLNNISGTIRITESADVYLDDKLLENTIYLKKLLDQVGEIKKSEIEKIKSINDFNL